MAHPPVVDSLQKNLTQEARGPDRWTFWAEEFETYIAHPKEPKDSCNGSGFEGKVLLLMVFFGGGKSLGKLSESLGPRCFFSWVRTKRVATNFVHPAFFYAKELRYYISIRSIHGKISKNHNIQSTF